MGNVSSPLRAEVSERHDLSFFCSLGVEESRGQLSIQSADASATPLIEFQYMTSPADLTHMRDVVRLTFEITQRAEFRRLSSTFRSLPTLAQMRSDSELDEWIMRHLGTSYHSAGTCKMGAPEDETAVVDQYCRVKGVEGLRVVDISILPTITRRPTNATAIMLGERASELMTRSQEKAEDPGAVEPPEKPKR